MGFDPLYCGLITTLICQFGVEILERWKVLKLAPVIRRRTSIDREAAAQASSPTRQEQVRIMLMRLTRSLDEEGRFRIQRRVSVDIMTGLWEFCLLMTVIVSVLVYPEFWYDALIAMDKDCVNFWMWRQSSASIIFYYLWFLAVNRQGAFPWGTYIHHCSAIVAASLILNGTYLPHALWYGATGTSLAFMVDVLFVWRGRYAYMSPEGTQKFARFTMYWYAMCCGLNLVGQIFITVNGVIKGIFNWVNVLLDVIMIAGWVYDDQILLRALYEYSISLYTSNELKTRMATQRGGVASPTGTNYLKPPPGSTQPNTGEKPTEFPKSPSVRSVATKLFSLRDSMQHTTRVPEVFFMALADPVMPTSPMAPPNDYEPTFPSVPYITTPLFPPANNKSTPKGNKPSSIRGRLTGALAVVKEEKNETSMQSTEVDKSPMIVEIKEDQTEDDTNKNINVEMANMVTTTTNAGAATNTATDRDESEFEREPDTQIDIHPHVLSPQTPLTHAGTEPVEEHIPEEHMSELDLNAGRARTDGEVELRKAIEAQGESQPTESVYTEGETQMIRAAESIRRYRPYQGGVDLGFALAITAELNKELENLQKEQTEMSKVASTKVASKQQ